MNMPRVCAVVQGRTLEAFLENLKEAQHKAGMVELRADSIEGFSKEMVQTIREATKEPAIFTCRKKEEGGGYEGAEEERHEIIKAADEAEFEYIDIELSAVKDLLRPAKTKLILSYHKFGGTPSQEKLRRVVVQMREQQPDLMKIAARVSSTEDIQALAKLLLEREKGEEMIVIGMGAQARN